MFNYIFLIFLGGAIGASLREILITMAPDFGIVFPVGIFLSNIIASFCLGVVAVLFKLKLVSKFINAFVATGVMGGLSTFSSFIYGSMEMMNSPGTVITAIIYIITTILSGFLFVGLGQTLGRNVGVKYITQ